MIDIEKEETASEMRGSMLRFTQFFFKHITGRDFVVSRPIGREAHQIIVCRELTKLFRGEIPSQRELINIPPGSGKTTLLAFFIAWSYTHYADCNFLYISYSHDLAAKVTFFIKTIMSCALYQHLFGIKIKTDSRAKDNFMTTAGGCVAAFGSSGSITGRDAGLPNLDRFSGAVVIDDPIKPDDANSDAIRGNVIRNYEETIRQRVRGHNVPIIFIGQRLHEDDLAAFLLDDNDTRGWDSVIIQALDLAGNAMYPEMMPAEELLMLQEKSPYVFASQYQQDPIPAGGALFKPEWFVELDDEPDIQVTFITADTAETDKNYNDATVFSFWGIYEIETMGRKTGLLGLHWIDCLEVRVEPKDLQNEFFDFWTECVRYPVVPHLAAIERKSTGVTLVNILQNEIRGITIKNIERSAASKNKGQRYLTLQPYIAEKRISFSKHARHKDMCIEHMRKITINDTHRHDDIADTMVDAVQIALIDKLLFDIKDTTEDESKLAGLNAALKTKQKAGAIRHGRSR